MTFDQFLNIVPKIQHMALPGEAAQLLMAPPMRAREMEKLKDKQIVSKNAAVMMVCYPTITGACNFILILRRTYKGVHSGQVGFPGGKWEHGDRNFEDTAMREVEEEIALSRKRIQPIKAFTSLFVPPSNFIVYPFLGYTIDVQPMLTPQESEVEEILHIPMEAFLNNQNLIERTLSTSYASNITVPAYRLNDHIVWGATAMMLSEIREAIKTAVAQ